MPPFFFSLVYVAEKTIQYLSWKAGHLPLETESLLSVTVPRLDAFNIFFLLPFQEPFFHLYMIHMYKGIFIKSI